MVPGRRAWLDGPRYAIAIRPCALFFQEDLFPTRVAVSGDFIDEVKFLSEPTRNSHGNAVPGADGFREPALSLVFGGEEEGFWGLAQEGAEEFDGTQGLVEGRGVGQGSSPLYL